MAINIKFLLKQQQKRNYYIFIIENVISEPFWSKQINRILKQSHTSITKKHIKTNNTLFLRNWRITCIESMPLKIFFMFVTFLAYRTNKLSNVNVWPYMNCQTIRSRAFLSTNCTRWQFLIRMENIPMTPQTRGTWKLFGTQRTPTDTLLQFTSSPTKQWQMPAIDSKWDVNSLPWWKLRSLNEKYPFDFF